MPMGYVALDFLFPCRGVIGLSNDEEILPDFSFVPVCAFVLYPIIVQIQRVVKYEKV